MQEVKEIIRALRCISSTKPAGQSCDGCPYLVHVTLRREELQELYERLEKIGGPMEWDSCDCYAIAHEAADALEEYAREVEE